MKLNTMFRSLALVVLLITGAATLHAQGKLEIVNGDTFNWGKVQPGDLKTTIEVRNAGSDELHISKVQPSCSCTASPIDKDVLQPGETGHINVTVHASNKAGELVKTIVVYSSDPQDSVKVIYLKADLRPTMNFEPVNYFLVNNVGVGVESPSTITIVNYSDKPFDLTAPQFVEGNVKVRFDLKEKRTLKPGEKLDVKAYITPTAAGAINGIVRMTSTTAENPQIEFRIWGNAIAPEPVKSALTPQSTPTQSTPVHSSR